MVSRKSSGFTLMEILIVVLMIGAAAMIALPRATRQSPKQEVNHAARQIARDLEQVRMKAIATKRRVRVKFDASGGFYTAYSDVTEERTGAINESVDETRASGLITRDRLDGKPGVRLSRGVKFEVPEGAGTGPFGESIGGDPITLEADRVEFDARGLTTPLGSAGVVFLGHERDGTAMAAVTISGAGSFQAWRYLGGEWVR